jgi:hypothetical protein
MAERQPGSDLSPLHHGSETNRRPPPENMLVAASIPTQSQVSGNGQFVSPPQGVPGGAGSPFSSTKSHNKAVKAPGTSDAATVA